MLQVTGRDPKRSFTVSKVSQLRAQVAQRMNVGRQIRSISAPYLSVPVKKEIKYVHHLYPFPSKPKSTIEKEACDVHTQNRQLLTLTHQPPFTLFTFNNYPPYQSYDFYNLAPYLLTALNEHGRGFPYISCWTGWHTAHRIQSVAAAYSAADFPFTEGSASIHLFYHTFTYCLHPRIWSYVQPFDSARNNLSRGSFY